MYKDADLANKIASKWSNFKEEWDKDLISFLKNTKDQIITFKTYTPSFNDGDPCDTSVELFCGSVYIDIEGGYIYKAFDNVYFNIVCAKIYQLRDYEECDDLKQLDIECRISDIDEFVKNNWISDEQVKAIKDFEISGLNYELSEFSREYEDKYYMDKKHSVGLLNFQMMFWNF